MNVNRSKNRRGFLSFIMLLLTLLVVGFAVVQIMDRFMKQNQPIAQPSDPEVYVQSLASQSGNPAIVDQVRSQVQNLNDRYKELN